LKRNIDGMALVKLNVLHLHLSDDEAFRIECRTHPELHEQGSDGHFFTQEQIRELIAYAADRGIRVVPELDLPGHCTSWLVSHPELAAAGKYSLARGLITSAPVLDATSEEVHALLADVYAEMAALFPDPYFHIGGDEADYLPWTENARIQNFIREHGLNGPAGLQALFARRLRELLIRQGKQVVGWEEVMRGDMPKDVVIQGWSGPEGEGHGHLDALRNGYRALLSNGYYLDLNHPAALLYQNEPWRGEQLPEGVKSGALLGGEATIWTEWVSQETLDSRIWPRTAAFAERLWSPRDIVDLDDMYRRLAIVSQRLEEAGLAHEKNRGPMVRRLAGSSATPEELRALSDFVDLVEPVKEYNRAKQQGGLNYLRALNSVADCARPESETGRQFTSQVNRFLGSRTETNLASALRTRLQTWAASARVTARFLSRQTTTDPAAAAVAENLLELCDGALTAIDALESSHRAEPEWSARFLTEVQTMEPGRDGILIPIVPAVRRLVEAARTQ
jgi:hexosaminidase